MISLQVWFVGKYTACTNIIIAALSPELATIHPELANPAQKRAGNFDLLF